MQVVNCIDKNRLFCSGSFTKLLTTYVSLSLLSEKYNLKDILDDENFLDRICINQQSKNFLSIFQNKIKNKFSIRDICTYYAGLPYTFDVAEDEIEHVELGNPFKHHSILDEKTFLDRCHTNMTAVYTNQCKFHYSELSIIFLGYLIEKIYGITIESLYHKYVLDKFKLKNSLFSRKRVTHLYCQDLTDKYDYPSVAILDHGYFCYSNGYFTTVNDMQILLESLLTEPIFLNYMVDINMARAASHTLMNGLTVEIRKVGDDIIYGYEGLSFSGCNIWAYSTKHKQGYITFTDDEEEAYKIYDLFGYSSFDIVPDHTEKIYKNFLKAYHENIVPKEIPEQYQGKYHRVKINKKNLETIFSVGKNFIIIRNPDEIQYDVIFANGDYRVRGKDKVHGAKVGFMEAKSGNKYMYYDGTLYKKLSSVAG